ncbi:hypothetical protein HK104_001251 [Borealophlyctis nickersoniae]|nr:hypothetical protein HK104_001251 [Borealophlyctis nickersoniae]
MVIDYSKFAKVDTSDSESEEDQPAPQSDGPCPCPDCMSRLGQPPWFPANGQPDEDDDSEWEDMPELIPAVDNANSTEGEPASTTPPATTNTIREATPGQGPETQNSPAGRKAGPPEPPGGAQSSPDFPPFNPGDFPPFPPRDPRMFPVFAHFMNDMMRSHMHEHHPEHSRSRNRSSGSTSSSSRPADSATPKKMPLKKAEKPSTNPAEKDPVAAGPPKMRVVEEGSRKVVEKLKTPSTEPHPDPANIQDPAERAHAYKSRANVLLAEGNLEEAIDMYGSAIALAKEIKLADDAQAVFHANRSAAHFKFANYGSAIADATKAIELNPEYAKAYFRRASALKMVGKLQSALSDLETLLELDSTNVDAERMLREVQSEIRGNAFTDALKTGVSAPKPTVTQGQPSLSVKEEPKKGQARTPPSLKELSAHYVAKEIDRSPCILDQLEPAIVRLILPHLAWSSLQLLSAPSTDSSKHHHAHMITTKLIDTTMKQQEDRYRNLFAVDPTNPVLSDPFLTLISVFDNHDLFRFSPSNPDLPELFPHDFEFDASASSVCSSLNEFKRAFDVFSMGQLSSVNFNNVLVAGGGVLAALLPQPVGANEKVVEIFRAVQKAIGKRSRLIAVRSNNVITFVANYPFPRVQIVLRLYKSPAEVLMGFDIDSCCVGFDGIKVLVLPRAARALKTRSNVVDMSRRSYSYEHRLLKYTKRGFSIKVPGLDRSRVSPAITEAPVWRRTDYKGLARLLIMEARWKEWKETGHSNDWTISFDRIDKAIHMSDQKLMDDLDRDIHIDEVGQGKSVVRAARPEEDPTSDYTSIRIPQGPRYRTVANVETFLNSVQWRANDEWYRFDTSNPPRAEVTALAFGDIADVLKKKVSTGVVAGTKKLNHPWRRGQVEALTFVHVDCKKMWMTENPGTQLTGSFNPLEEDWDDWVRQAYDKNSTRWGPPRT